MPCPQCGSEMRNVSLLPDEVGFERFQCSKCGFINERFPSIEKNNLKKLKVVIAGSLRFEKEMKEYAESISHKFEIIHVAGLCKGCTIPKECYFYQMIRKADYLIVFTKNGYFGKAVSTEIGFAVGIGKTVFMVEDLDVINMDNCVRPLISGKLKIQ